MSAIIIFPTLLGFAFFTAEEIISCECDGRKTVISTTDGRKVSVVAGITETERKLKNKIFFKCKRGIIANTNHILELKNGTDSSVLVMRTNKKIEISRRARVKLYEMFGL
jgi:DNA-binding LytR/AlgR family response regulator